MFGSPFNRTFFNRPAETKWELFLSALFSDKLCSFLSVGTDFSLSCFLNDALSSRASLVHGVPTALSLSEGLSAFSPLLMQSPACHTLSQSLRASSRLCKDFPCSHAFCSGWNSSASLSENFSLALACSDSLGCTALLSKNILLNSHHTAFLHSFASLHNPLSQTVWLPVSLAPGDSLTLDTQQLLLLINNQNALYLHSGDWPFLSRETAYLEIDSPSGSPEGTLSFTPAFL